MPHQPGWRCQFPAGHQRTAPRRRHLRAPAGICFLRQHGIFPGNHRSPEPYLRLRTAGGRGRTGCLYSRKVPAGRNDQRPCAHRQHPLPQRKAGGRGARHSGGGRQQADRCHHRRQRQTDVPCGHHVQNSHPDSAQGQRHLSRGRKGTGRGRIPWTAPRRAQGQDRL